MERIIAAVAVSLLAVSAASANLVVSGNFEADNTGFESDFTFDSDSLFRESI